MSLAALALPKVNIPRPWLPSGGESGIRFSINFVRHQGVPLRVRHLLAVAMVGYLLSQAVFMIGLLTIAQHRSSELRHLEIASASVGVLAMKQRAEGKR